MKRHNVCKIARLFPRLFLILALALSFSAKTVNAQQDNISREEQEAQRKAEVKSISETVEQTLAAEQETVAQLKGRLKELKESQRDFEEQMTAYNLQISSFNSKLLAPAIKVAEVEKAFSAQKAALSSIAERIKTLEQRLQEIQARREQTENQYEINQKQLENSRGIQADDPATRALTNKLDFLADLISTKRDILKEMEGIYTTRLDRLASIREKLAALSENFTQKIEQRRRDVLFQRQQTPIVSMQAWKQLQEELGFLMQQSGLLIKPQFWTDQFNFLWDSAGLLFFSSLLLFIVAEIIFLKLRRLCLMREQQLKPAQAPWRVFTLRLLGQSLPLLGAVVFLYGYARLKGFYVGVPVVRIGIQVLAVWLYTQWGLGFVKLWQEGTGPYMPTRLAKSLHAFILFVRCFAIVYIVLDGIITTESVLEFLLRIFFETALLAWAAWILRNFRKDWSNSIPLTPKSRAFVKFLVITVGYIIAGGPLLLELAGFGQMAQHSYTSWGRTVVVLMWAWLFFFVIREWEGTIRTTAPSSAQTELKTSTKSLWWFLLRVSWVAWAGLFSIAILLAWGAEGPFIVAFFRMLNHPIPLGAIQLSLLGLVYAVMILFLTRVIIHFWRILLERKILADSGMEMGLQASISRISVYLLWALGILISLNAIGISTTSLAVVFGALGIGLGFGLQNIFSNFISGLILLFERPIQVGDSIEVAGIWGTVTRINVRATVVQTFDNASLIIPNSEFISGQVINWTFKDLRLRRNLDVGVAYGSDTELTRDTLIGIASNHPRVLKYPKPDVLFMDFGDSALIFRLRIWTTLDHCLQAETDIRFEIDRLFREYNIEIAFPQRDIHIRSVEDKAEAVPFNKAQGETQEAQLEKTGSASE